MKRYNNIKYGIIEVDNKEVPMDKSKLPQDIVETIIELGAILVSGAVLIMIALIMAK